MKKKYGLLLMLTVILLLSRSVCAVFARDVMADTWVGALNHDGVVMEMPTNAQAGNPRANRTVGMFYYIWHDNSVSGYAAQDLYKISLGLRQYGQEKSYHWWSEPYFGYYSDHDPFIIRKHAQMLTDAGVDVILFDNTNAATYTSVIKAILKEYTAMQNEGMDVPKLSAVFHFNPESAATELYNDIFNRSSAGDQITTMADNLWFQWRGKKLLLADINEIRNNLPDHPEIADLFSQFETRPSWTSYGEKTWPWVSASWSYSTYNGTREEVAVATADPSVSGKGKSSTKTQRYTSGWNPKNGTFFKAQWEHALSIDPAFVFVTQWNEWIAMYFRDNPVYTPGFKSCFIDCWSWEYNRDIEPMRDYHENGYGYGDNYYYYLVNYIRRYKGVRPLPASSGVQTIDVAGSASQWDSVQPEFLDDVNDQAYRNFHGSVLRDEEREDDEYYHYDTAEQACFYTNFTGDNDIDTVKVTRDSEYVYFYVKTGHPISDAKESGWMNVLINSTLSYTDGFFGYNYMINRQVDPDAMIGTVEVTGGGWNWSLIGWIDLHVDGNVLQFAVPRAWIGFENSGSQTMDFKVFDGMPYDESGFDVIQFLDMGDAAPNARFNYRYSASFPEMSGRPVTYKPVDLDVDLFPELESYVLHYIAADLQDAQSVRFTTSIHRGVMQDGRYVKNVMLGEFNDRVNYKVLNASGDTLAYGTLNLRNQSKINTFTIKDAAEQTLTVNHNEHTAELSAYYLTKLWKAKLIPNCDGTITLDGQPVNGRNTFDLYHQKTGHELVYEENGQTVTYDLTVRWSDPPVAVNRTVYYPNNSVPTAGSAWTFFNDAGHGMLTTATFADTTCLMGANIAQHHMYALAEKFPSPYIFTCALGCDDASSNTEYSNFLNIRGKTNFDYITECGGIWIGVKSNILRLLVNGSGSDYVNNFHYDGNYSIAVVDNITPANQDFVTLRVIDNGSDVLISVLSTEGSYIDVFYIDEIGTTTFHYQNKITGATGTATMKDNCIANPGYISFFNHAGNNVYWGPMSLATNYEEIKLAISQATLLDSVTGKEVSKNTIIDNDARTITFTVSETQNLRPIEPIIRSTIKGTIFRVGGKILSSNPFVNLSDTAATSMIVAGGGATRTYKIYVNRGTVPEFEFDGVKTQKVTVDTEHGVIDASVGADTDLSHMRLITNSDGITMLDGLRADYEWFDMRNQLTGHAVVYTENGVTQEYVLNISVADKAVQGTVVPNELSGSSLPNNTSLWKTSGQYAVREKYGSPAIGAKVAYNTESNDLLTLKSVIETPYVLEYDVAVDFSVILGDSPRQMAFTNLRSKSNGEWITSYHGIWFGFISGNAYLLTSSNDFTSYSNYSIAAMDGTVGVDNGFVTVRVCDTGDAITIFVKKTNGAWLKLFHISSINSSGFSYENCITGMRGSGVCAANSILDKGYIGFFRHGGSEVFLKNIRLYSNLTILDNPLQAFNLWDPETGEYVSANVVIDQKAGTITVDTVEGADLSRLRVTYNAELQNSVLSLAGTDVQNQIANFTSPVELVLSNGQNAQSYMVTVRTREPVGFSAAMASDVVWLSTQAYVPAEIRQAPVYIAYYDEEGRLLRTCKELRKINPGFNSMGFELMENAPEGAERVTVLGLMSNTAGVNPSMTAVSF